MGITEIIFITRNGVVGSEYLAFCCPRNKVFEYTSDVLIGDSPHRFWEERKLVSGLRSYTFPWQGY